MRFPRSFLRPAPAGSWIGSLLLLTTTAAAAAAAPAPAPTFPRSTSSAAVRISPSTPPGGWFDDVTEAAGIRFTHQFCHSRIANIVLSNGSGGAVFDFDADGFPDLYFVNWGPLDGVTAAASGTRREPNRLYRNLGDGRFEDVTRSAGVEGVGFGSAAVAGDLDNDGDADLYVVNIGRSRLYRNCGDGRFEDVTDVAGVGHVGTGIAAALADIDRDGWLDLFVANYLTYVPAAESEQNPGAYPGPLAYAGETNVLYRNRGGGVFQDVTAEAGIGVPGNRAMAVVAFDANDDGAPDFYVSNDDTPNGLWLNEGGGRFRDAAIECGVAFNSIGEACGSMMGAVGDADNDGRPDLLVTRFGYGSLYRRLPSGFYEDRMWASGLGAITQPYVGWGGCWIDYDNDGDQDLFIANGDAFTLKGSRSLLLENDGAGRFRDVSDQGGAFFRATRQSRGAGVVDLDNDGRLDLVVTTLAGRPALLRNRGTSLAHWVKFDLRGTRSNRDGYGAQVTVKAGDATWRRESICPTGFLLQGDRRLHFGLGTHTRVDSVQVRWPTGVTQTLTHVPIDQVVRIFESSP